MSNTQTAPPPPPPVPPLSASVDAEIRLTANGGGLNRVLGEVNKNMLHLAGPMLEIANGGNVISAAWSGVKMVIEQKLLGPMMMVVPLAMGASRALRNLANDANLVGRGLEQVSKMQVIEGQFTPLLKSAEAAKAKVMELQKFADKSPFRMDEVAAGAKSLELFSRGAFSGQEALKVVGDAAALAGTSFGDMANTIGQLYDGISSGRAVGELTGRLQELGVVSGGTRNRIEQLQQSGADAKLVFAETWGAVETDLKRAGGQMDVLSTKLVGLKSTMADAEAGNTAAFAAAATPIETKKTARNIKEQEALRPMYKAWGEVHHSGDEAIEDVKGFVSKITIQTATFSGMVALGMASLGVAIKLALATAAAYAGRTLLRAAQDGGGLTGVTGGARRFLGGVSAASQESATALFRRTDRGLSEAATTARVHASATMLKYSAGVADYGAAEALLRNKSPEMAARRQELLARLGHGGSGDERRREEEARRDVRRLASQERIASITPAMRSRIYTALGTGVDPNTGAHPVLRPANSYTPAQRTAVRGITGANMTEAIAGVQNLNRTTNAGVAGMGLLAKAASGAGGVIKSVFSQILAPTLVIGAISMVWAAFAKYFTAISEAKKAAKEGAKASDLQAKSFQEEAIAASTAEKRMEAYGKALSRLAEAKAKVEELKAAPRDLFSSAQKIKEKAAERDVKVFSQAVAKQEAIGPLPGGFSVAEQKQYMERLAHERQLQMATEERVSALLSGSEQAAAAMDRETEAVKRRQAAEEEHGAIRATTSSPEYVRAAQRESAAQAVLADKDKGQEAKNAATETVREAQLEKRKMEMESESRSLNLNAKIGKEEDRATGLRDQLDKGGTMLPHEVKAKLEEEVKEAWAAQRAAAMDGSMGEQSATRKRWKDAHSRLDDVDGTIRDDEMKPLGEREFSGPTVGAEREQVQAELLATQARMEALRQEKDALTQRLNPTVAREEEVAAKASTRAGLQAEAGALGAKQMEGIDQKTKAAMDRSREDFVAKRTKEGAGAGEIATELAGPEFVAFQAKIKTDGLDEKQKLIIAAGKEQMMAGKEREKILQAYKSGGEIPATQEAQDEAERVGRSGGGSAETQARAAREHLKGLSLERVERRDIAAGAFGNKDSLESRLQALQAEREGVSVETREQTGVAAERGLTQGAALGEAKRDGLLSSLKVRGNGRQEAEDAAAVENAKIAAADAAEKLRLAQDFAGSPDLRVNLAQTEEELGKAPASERDGLRKKRDQILAAQEIRRSPGAEGALEVEVEQKRGAVAKAERTQKENREDTNYATSEAIRSSQLGSVRMLEKRAQSRGDRDALRARGDALEDASNYDRAKIQARELGLAAPQQEKFAQLQADKAKAEREIERNTTPAIASDLARVGGASGEVAGGDIPRQQLETLKQIVTALGGLRPSGQSVAGPSTINPMNTELR